MARIVVIDDDPSIVQMLQFLLGKDQHSVLVARDGEEGLALVRTAKPDLIILDVMMPKMDGFTVSGNLFKDPDLRTIPILIFTAKGNAREIFQLVPNVGLYLEKPFEPSTFLSHVNKLLQSSPGTP